MEVIRTVKTVKNGQVILSLPSEFSGQEVEIIVMKKEHSQVRKNSLKGSLKMYAKPELITLESKAWENATEEKYDHR